MGEEILKEIDETYPDELLTRAEYAALRGVAARTIGKYVQKEVIPLWDNKIWPEQADRLLNQYLAEPLGSGNHDKNTGIMSAGRKKANNSYTEARTQEKNLKIELLELDVALKKGQMVLTKDVEFAAFSAARELRDRMLNIPDRVAAIVAAETDEIKVREIIENHIELELTAALQEKFNTEQSEN